jgi:threonine/homoserine/homoserine lactone efflux protein
MWPWLTIAGLGAFHGLNPAMGWLFAVALGLHRGRRRTVWMSLVPIALGHALSIAAVVLGVVALGMVVDAQALEIVAGIALLGWSAWHIAYGHRHRVRVGMQTGLLGLGLWSFSIATAHGAGLMLMPVVLPLCSSGTPASG